MSGVLHGVIASLKAAAAAATDSFFKYVTLLLNTTSTNGAQNNTFLDSSTNNFSITRNGNTTQGTFSPFSQTGWSNYFDGTGDYLTLASNAAFGLGTGDFTIEMWVYATANTANGPGTIFDLRTTNNATAAAIRVTSSLNILFYNGPANTEINVGTIQLNTWVHIAHVRSSGSLKTYINGTLSNTTAVSNNLGSNQPCMIGNNQTAGYSWNGYISGARIVKGTAVYTANFTPPTAPLTAITNTSLLCNFTNAGIYDASAINDLETVGNAQVSTTVTKFGTTSMAFDGTGDYLTVPNNAAFDFRSSDFTIEAWVNIASASGVKTIVSKISNFGPFLIVINGTTVLYYLSSTGSSWNIANGVSGGTVSVGAWAHVALVRSGSTFTPYVNGVAGTTTTSASALAVNTHNVLIGALQTSAPSIAELFNGYIDDLRITNGYARYTANFTPPTAAFPTS